jgi:hypothetical protein
VTSFDDEQLIHYVLRSAESHDVHAVEQGMRCDPELAAKVQLMRQSVDAFVDPPVRPRLWRPGIQRLVPRSKHLVVCLVLLVSVGLGWAGWVALGPKPLLADDFNHQWFDSVKWRPERVGIRQDKGYLALVDRGYLTTQNEYNEPISVSFEWRWSQFKGYPLYADHIAVVLRTSGRPQSEFPYEPLDGIVVKFDAWGGDIKAYSVAHPSVRVVTTPGALPMASDQWHRIRITDDGDTVRVYLSGPEIRQPDPNAPVLQLRCSDHSGKGRIAIYNREHLAGVPHESHIRNFVLNRLPPPPA